MQPLPKLKLKCVRVLNLKEVLAPAKQGQRTHQSSACAVEFAVAECTLQRNDSYDQMKPLGLVI